MNAVPPAATRSLYRPVFDQLGHGPATAAVEMRFAPLLDTAQVTDTVIDGRHVLACGPHLLISLHEHHGELPLTEVERLDERTQPVLSTSGRCYLHLVSDHLDADPPTVRSVLAGQVTVPHRTRTVTVFPSRTRTATTSPPTPDFHNNGTFPALHLYPATESRKRSGYTDATRHVLNTLLAYKAARGLGRRDPFPTVTFADVLARLEAATAELGQGVNRRAAEHLADTVLPLQASYAEALELAGYPTAAFFSRNFTIDTGQIVNQGRAMGLFRGLVSLDGEPPREERGFGTASLSSVRGPIWRIAPIPFIPNGTLPLAIAGGKNTTADRPTLVIEELDPCHLRPVMRGTCTSLRRYTVTGVELEHLSLDEGRAELAMPGLLAAA
ncbi:hypothetical protein ABZ897_42895 [Nonomuraea sp. NPDC046802]|uniref:hypothetical protein n=1 Tax=Nonomuraea sp. NPDC046802 TaxID=3154919 RepID=UPI00340584B5